MQTNNENINLIIKHLTNQADEQDIATLFAWIKENTENEKLFEDYKKTWEITKNKEFKTISSTNIDKEWSLFKENTEIDTTKNNLKIKKKNNFSAFYRVAAVIFIILSIGGVYLLTNKKETQITAENSVIMKSLSDGSEVTLNKKATIKYDKNYNTKQRLIELTNGEANFKVSHDKIKKFKVLAGKIIIEAVGTEFYIKTDNKKTEIIVSEGIVKTYFANDTTHSILLKKDEKAVYSSSTNKISKVGYINPNYLSWKTKSFKFKNTPLSEIATYIENVYDIKIIFENPKLKNCKLTVSFDNQSIESIMKVLESFLNINIKIKGKIIELQGDSC